MPSRVNAFFIAANIIIDIKTGETKQVLTLVNRKEDATVFSTEEECNQYFTFVRNRINNIRFFLERSTEINDEGWVIRGEQERVW